VVSCISIFLIEQIYANLNFKIEKSSLKKLRGIIVLVEREFKTFDFAANIRGD